MKPNKGFVLLFAFLPNNHFVNKPVFAVHPSFIMYMYLVCLLVYICLKVKVLYVRNLTQDTSEDTLKDVFEGYGKVERVKKLKDYAFVHFEDRDCAVKVKLN